MGLLDPNIANKTNQEVIDFLARIDEIYERSRKFIDLNYEPVLNPDYDSAYTGPTKYPHLIGPSSRKYKKSIIYYILCLKKGKCKIYLIFTRYITDMEPFVDSRVIEEDAKKFIRDSIVRFRGGFRKIKALYDSPVFQIHDTAEFVNELSKYDNGDHYMEIENIDDKCVHSIQYRILTT